MRHSVTATVHALLVSDGYVRHQTVTATVHALLVSDGYEYVRWLGGARFV